MSTIEAWLAQLGLEQYENLFVDNAIDLDVLAELGEQDFEALGIKLGHRRKLLRAIRELSAYAPAVAPDENRSHPPPPAPEAERRHLTVMFCDMVGSTELAQQLDPEDLRELMAVSQSAWSQAVERYEGYVARYMGDGILAYFGYPRAHEDDAERAVRAGMEILEHAGASAARPSVRIGIASGLVVVGDLIGAGAAQENAVVGETPNLAARLQAIATPDTLVVSATTRELLGDRFHCVELGALDLKGYRERGDGLAGRW